MSQLSIKVTIAGRIYPITVQADEEDRVRKAAMDVDNNLKQLQDNYVVKDKQDLLAMTALQNATKLLELEEKSMLSIEPGLLDQLELKVKLLL